MEYTTYISASEKLSNYGQKARSIELAEYANMLERKKINVLSFDMLVGNIREFKGAKFESIRVIKENSATSILSIFTYESNTFRINSTIDSNGEISWREGNLFSNRLSVKNYEKLIKIVCLYQSDMKKMLSEKSLTVNDIKVQNRTFYL